MMAVLFGFSGSEAVFDLHQHVVGCTELTGHTWSSHCVALWHTWSLTIRCPQRNLGTVHQQAGQQPVWSFEKRVYVRIHYYEHHFYFENGIVSPHIVLLYSS